MGLLKLVKNPDVSVRMAWCHGKMQLLHPRIQGAEIAQKVQGPAPQVMCRSDGHSRPRASRPAPPRRLYSATVPTRTAGFAAQAQDRNYNVLDF